MKITLNVTKQDYDKWFDEFDELKEIPNVHEKFFKYIEENPDMVLNAIQVCYYETGCDDFLEYLEEQE